MKTSDSQSVIGLDKLLIGGDVVIGSVDQNTKLATVTFTRGAKVLKFWSSKFTCYSMADLMDRIFRMSTCFGLQAIERDSPPDMLRFVFKWPTN